MTLHVEAVAELSIEEACRAYYRWWRVFGWWRPNDRGLKLGPVTVSAYRPYRRWRLMITFWGRFTLYDGVVREMRRREYT